MMLLFFFFEAFFEKYKPPIGHQTSATITVGVAVSFVLWYFLGESQTKHFAFNPETFFNFFLPPIIFKAGYTMRKRTFFENLGNTAMFGVGATFICFAIYSILTWVLVFSTGLQMTNYYASKKHIDTSYYASNPSPVSLSIM